MKLLLVFLVFFLCSYYSNAQLLDEGSTTTTEIEIQGGVEEVLLLKIKEMCKKSQKQLLLLKIKQVVIY